jgi:hypothetical protein
LRTISVFAIITVRGEYSHKTGVQLVPTAVKKSALVRALGACVDERQKRQIRRFLLGLATDELQYIAEFLGSCILESGGRCCTSRTQVAEAIKRFERTRRVAQAEPCASGSIDDHEHKMILLLEYLCRSGLTQFTVAVGAGQR